MSNQLPAQLTSFIGREREAAEALRLLRERRLVTLTGIGGVGKTRLALQIAQFTADAYPDGVWLVELAALADASLVPAAVAARFGLGEEPRQPLLTRLIAHLESKALLLLLDNCEHLLDACAPLSEALLRACPRFRILVTSRQALGISGEAVQRVASLALPPNGLHEPSGSPCAGEGPPSIDELLRYEAVCLFVDRARAVNAEFNLTEQNAPAVSEICRRLEGIPLAIELAAARLKVLTAEQIAHRLDDRFRLLTTGSRTARPRQQTLRSTIDWSHGLLSEPERMLLRHLAVFAGPWALESAEFVCALDPRDESAMLSDVLDLLTELVDKSLVVAEERRGEVWYRLLDTIREYALERLEASGEAELLRRRHAERYVALVEEADQHLLGPQQGQWFDRLQIEHDNLRAAFDWLIAHDPNLGLRLGAALWRFWDLRGYLSEGRERLGLLMERAELRGQPAARVLNGIGALARKQGDFDVARRTHQQSLAISRDLDDRRGIAVALNSLALATYELGDYEAARALHEESLAIMRELGDEWGTSMSLTNLAMDLRALGDVAAAIALHEESLAIKRRIGDLRGEALVLNNLGVSATALGDLAMARTRHEESLAIKRQLDTPWGIGYSLRNLGAVAFEQRDYEAATRWYAEALSVAGQLGDRSIMTACLHWLGAIAGARGATRDAVRMFGAAQALREAISAGVTERARAQHDREAEAARAVLGDEAFAVSWEEGRAMPLEEAVAFALASARLELEQQHDPSPDDPEDALSPREREVAVLVAQGLTNRQIADQFVIARSTVDRHVVNILRKLELSSRAQVAAWATEQRLAATTG